MVPIVQNFLSDKPPDFKRITNMSRLHQISPESATGKAKELLDAVRGKHELNHLFGD